MQRNDLVTTFKSCLNILRDNEGLSGEKALRNLSYLLVLKLIEPRINNGINIGDFDYDFSIFDGPHLEQSKRKLFEIVHFSELANSRENDLPLRIKCLWDIILSKHPTTKNIFLENKCFDIQRDSTYKKLISKLSSLNLGDTEYDVLGNAYEEVIQDTMTGKVFGQFFTQPLVKKMMVKLIDPQVHPDGSIETCADPAMGTGGFLITYLQYIQDKAKTKNINLDWNFIKTQGLYGKELEPDTYQLAVSNMLISSGHMFESLDRGDSIREPINKKFDNILANPPFGIKGLNYDDFQSVIKNSYVPIKTDNAVSLFLQAIIYMLKINGKCAVVLPDGKDLFSKTNKVLIQIREYLMKTCDLKEVIYLPSGMFEYTSVKTCVFYFVKKVEGTTILEINDMVSKQKKINRTYKFNKQYQTTNVKFYEYDFDTDSKNLLVDVPIEKIVNNFYSLNHIDYIESSSENQYNNGTVTKSIGEICIFLPKSKRSASYGKSTGTYPFYTSSHICNKYCDIYDFEDECLVIGTGGVANIKYSDKFSCSTDNFVLKNNSEYLLKYIYYYLFINIDVLQKGFMGAGLQHISKEYVMNIKIPFPPIDKQQLIVEYLDFIYEKSIKTSKLKITELKHLNELCLINQKMFGENNNKKLNELCEFIKTGKNKPKDNKTGTLYPYYGTGAVTGYTNEYLYDGHYILTARNGSIGNCFLTEGKFFPSDHMFVIDIKNKCLMKYVYYILLDNEQLDKLKTGVGIPNITKGILENLVIPVPSCKRLEEIVKYCECNDILINHLEKEIANNKKQAQQFIECVVNSRNIEAEIAATEAEINEFYENVRNGKNNI